nr:transposase (putative), gypsy type [Tanacetum cinerariifolium]
MMGLRTRYALQDLYVLGYERLKEQIEEFQDAQMNIVNDKVAKLDADLLEMAFHLEEKFYPHLINTISGRRWLLTRGLRLVVVKCLDSHEYLFALEAAISRAIEKGMQDGLSAGIDHGKAGRSLEDVVAYNPSVEEDYPSTFQSLREVDFPLLVELKSHKDASITNVMDLLHLEGQLANALGMSDLQLHVDQLMLLVHRSEDQVVLVETSLSFALNVTHSYAERIRQNVEARRSTPIGVWTPLVDPLSIKNLIGDAKTSNRMPVIAATTTALSITFASASTVPPITIEDYEIMGTDGPEDAEGSSQAAAASFLNTVEFEKKELDTTPEHDPPS